MFYSKYGLSRNDQKPEWRVNGIGKPGQWSVSKGRTERPGQTNIYWWPDWTQPVNLRYKDHRSQSDVFSLFYLIFPLSFICSYYVMFKWLTNKVGYRKRQYIKITAGREGRRRSNLWIKMYTISSFDATHDLICFYCLFLDCFIFFYILVGLLLRSLIYFEIANPSSEGITI